MHLNFYPEGSGEGMKDSVFSLVYNPGDGQGQAVPYEPKPGPWQRGAEERTDLSELSGGINMFEVWEILFVKSLGGNNGGKTKMLRPHLCYYGWALVRPWRDIFYSNNR